MRMRMSIALAALVVVALVPMRSSAMAGRADQAASAAAALPKVVVYKDPNCGCCSLWMEHMRRAGFTVTSVDSTDMAAVHQMYRVPAAVQSCHVALVDKLVVEGHVPADDVKRMLKERPNVLGIAVPGMPLGSPGMEQGSTKQPYKVLTFDAAGKTTVFAQR